MASLCSADVDVVVNLEGADIVVPDPVSALPNYLDMSSMDNSDLFVAMCLPGTFSPNHEGICHDCVKCVANQYEKVACIPTRDRTCANCTICGAHDLELCQCAVKTAQCITGDRVCLKVPPTAVNLNVDFSTGVVLTSRQLAFVKAGIAAGFTEWLAVQFDVDVDTVELLDVVRFDPTNFQARFRFNEVYGAAKVNRILGQPHDFFQGGFAYTFGTGGVRRRRLLQVAAVEYQINANGASGSCDVDNTCPQNFTVWVYDENSTCTGACHPTPCPPGYGGYATNCQLCEPGTFKNESGYGECEGCPAGYTSPTGSTWSGACYPRETFSAGEGQTSTSTSSTTLQGTAAAQLSLPSSSTTRPSTSPSTPPLATSSRGSSPPTSPGSQASPGASSGPSGTPSPPPWAPPGESSTSQASQPQQPGTGQTTSSTGGGTGIPYNPPSSGGSSVNTNTNTNNININVAPPAPAPVINIAQPAININVQLPPPPPVYVSVPSSPPPPLSPVFNNNIVVQPPPSMSDPVDYHYHRHAYYYDNEGDMGDWGLFVLILFVFASVAAAAACLVYPGCGGYCYGEPQPRRHVVRYEIVRQQPGEGQVVRV